MSSIRRRVGVGVLALSVSTACGQGNDRERITDRPEGVTTGAGWFPIGPAPLRGGQVAGGNGVGLDVTGRASDRRVK